MNAADQLQMLARLNRHVRVLARIQALSELTDDDLREAIATANSANDLVRELTADIECGKLIDRLRSPYLQS